MTELLVFEDKAEGNEIKVRLVKTNGKILVWSESESESHELECATIAYGREQFSMLVTRLVNELSGGLDAGNI